MSQTKESYKKIQSKTSDKISYRPLILMFIIFLSTLGTGIVIENYTSSNVALGGALVSFMFWFYLASFFEVVLLKVGLKYANSN